MTKASDIRARMSRTVAPPVPPPDETVAPIAAAAPASRPKTPARPAPSAPQRPPKPIRITLDLDPDAYQELRQFASLNYRSAAAVLRALLRELGQDEDLAARIRAALGEP